MALSDIDLSPGFVTQLSVTPILRETTLMAKERFLPEHRGCYFDGELDFTYLPNTLYRQVSRHTLNFLHTIQAPNLILQKYMPSCFTVNLNLE